MLKGKKTYIVAVLAGLITVAHSLGYINEEMQHNLMSGLTALGLMGLRAAVSDSNGQ